MTTCILRVDGLSTDPRVRASHVYSPDNCCCRRIPLRASAPPSYPYDLGHMRIACPLKLVRFSLTDHLSTDETICSSSTVSLWPFGKLF